MIEWTRKLDPSADVIGENLVYQPIRSNATGLVHVYLFSVGDRYCRFAYMDSSYLSRSDELALQIMNQVALSGLSQRKNLCVPWYAKGRQSQVGPDHLFVLRESASISRVAGSPACFVFLGYEFEVNLSADDRDILAHVKRHVQTSNIHRNEANAAPWIQAQAKTKLGRGTVGSGYVVLSEDELDGVLQAMKDDGDVCNIVNWNGRRMVVKVSGARCVAICDDKVYNDVRAQVAAFLREASSGLVVG